jgi:hypothetical protein
MINPCSSKNSQSVSEDIRPEESVANDQGNEFVGSQMLKPGRMKKLGNLDAITEEQSHPYTSHGGKVSQEREENKYQHCPQVITCILRVEIR